MRSRGTEDQWLKRRVLAALALKLATLGLLDEAFVLAQESDDDETRARLLARSGRVADAITAAERIKEDGDREWFLREQTCELVEAGRIDDALVVARRIDTENARAAAFVVLLPRLAEAGRVDEMLAMAQGIGDEWYRATALADLVRHLDPTRTTQLLAEAREIDDARSRAELLAALDELQDALIAVGQIGVEEDDQDNVLLALVNRLVMLRKIEAALALASKIRDEGSRFEAIFVLVPHLTTVSQLREALAVARVIGDASESDSALAELAPWLAESRGIDEALALAWRIRSPWDKALALALLGRLHQAIASARRIDDDDSRDFAWDQIVRRLTELDRLDEAIAAVREIGKVHGRESAPAVIVCRLAESGRVEEAFAKLRQIFHKQTSERDFARLAPSLVQSDKLEGAFEAKNEFYGPAARALARAELGMVGEVHEAPSEIGEEHRRKDALAAIVPRLAMLPQAEALSLLLDTIRVSATRPRSSLLLDLVALAPIIAAIDPMEAIAETCQAIEDVFRWWP